jgi:hypothetical protein
MCQSKHSNALNVILLYYMSRATCFDSPESSSGPQGSDPYNNEWYNTLWNPQRLQLYYSITKETKGTEIQRKESSLINIGGVKYSEFTVWDWQGRWIRYI